ncbi:hypothetical protein SAMN05216389_101271 [Oceanobacillus limi]|uniref:Uncharacterized protein n=1 Tax=Oceanobacillus limi TaxID=930131 RepID=A0A1H9Y9D9_9BACI|nr:hypothetical protein [Oceanobacillus limi]SES65543.1 hypothetical protein SAMN05216389_101271 [Oceanobacillus limi]
MSEWKLTGIVMVEVLLALFIGLGLTNFGLLPFYHQLGIVVGGDVWIVWFAVATILFSVYTVLFASRVHYPMKNRLKSKLFWLLWLASIIVVLLPFIQGEVLF